MVNTNIQSSIPLEGPGLRYRPTGNYQKGEFSELKNLEVVNGEIRSRRPIYPNYLDAAGTNNPAFGAAMDYFVSFSNSADITFAIGLDTVWSLGNKDHGGGVYYNFNPAVLPPAVGGNSPLSETYTPRGHFVLANFWYDEVPYWLTHVVSPDNACEYWLYWGNKGEANITPTYKNTLPPNSKKILTFSNVNNITSKELNNTLRKVFIHKDRLFIVTEGNIYFSKATDPTTFAIPDGGFIGIETGAIWDAVAMSDTIYIASENKTYAYTYSVDPNEDGYLRPIYNNESITALCVHQGNIYGASSIGFYGISNSNFSKIIDFTETFQIIDFSTQIKKLVPFGDSIYILRSEVSPANGREVKTSTDAVPSKKSLVCFNTTNGSLSEVTFEDATDLYASGATNNMHGVIVDIDAPPLGTTLNIAVIWRDTAMKSKTRFYRSDLSRNIADNNSENISLFSPSSTSGLDRVLTSTGTKVKRRIQHDMFIPPFTPDGTKYLTKKFRFLLMEGNLPTLFGTFCTLYYFNTKTEQPNLFGGFDQRKIGVSTQSPKSFRYHVNQRSNTIAIRLAVDSVNGASDVTDADKNMPNFVNFKDIRLLWSYTGNMPTSTEPWY